MHCNIPGTGKTTTLVQLVRLVLAEPGARILVASDSNQAVCNLLAMVIALATASPGGRLMTPEETGILRVGNLQSIKNPKASMT